MVLVSRIGEVDGMVNLDRVRENKKASARTRHGAAENRGDAIVRPEPIDVDGCERVGTSTQSACQRRLQ
jgi:hypothetical protein